jgi:hypothetical protein
MKFFFHYNKPASQQKGFPVISLHYQGACHLCRALTCEVPTQTKSRATAPKLVVEGHANKIYWRSEGGTARIV